MVTSCQLSFISRITVRTSRSTTDTAERSKYRRVRCGSASITRHRPSSRPRTTPSTVRGSPRPPSTSSVIESRTSRPTAATRPCFEPKWYEISALFWPLRAATFAVVRPA